MATWAKSVALEELDEGDGRGVYSLLSRERAFLRSRARSEPKSSESPGVFFLFDGEELHLHEEALTVYMRDGDKILQQLGTLRPSEIRQTQPPPGAMTIEGPPFGRKTHLRQWEHAK